MINQYYFGQLVEELHFKVENPRAKYAWITVEKNEGLEFEKQINRMAQLQNSDVDIIVVDGGSTDGSVKIDHLKAIGVNTLLISHAKAGFSRDLQIGLIYAMRNGYSGVITVDGNGKDSCERINQFIHALDLGFDYIQGSRFIVGGEHLNTPILRLIGIKLLAAPITHFFSKHKITDPTNGFRGYSRNLLTSKYLSLGTNIYNGYNLVSFIPVVAGKEELLIKEIPVSRNYPSSGIVPTKIISYKQWIQIFLDLFRAGFGKFEKFPENESESIS